MATSGAKYPTLGESASESPWSDNGWTTPTNIYSDDGGTASVTAATYDAGDRTYVLKATGFDFSGIPDGSIINGVICVVNTWYATVVVSMDLMQLLDVNKTKGGTNQCETPVALGVDTGGTVTKGSSTDSWGNSLTAAWVKNSNFGVALGFLAGGSGNSNNDVYVDYVTLEVYYTTPVFEALVGTVTGSGGIAGIVRRIRRESGGLVGAGATAGLIKRTRRVGGTVAGTGVMAAVVRKLRSFKGTLVGAGLSAGVLTVVSGAIELLVGVLSGAGTIAGNLKRTLTLAGLSAGSGTVVGLVKRTRKVSGEITGTGGVTGALRKIREFAGTLVGTGTVGGALQVLVSLNLKGVLSGAGTLVSSLKSIRFRRPRFANVEDTIDFQDLHRNMRILDIEDTTTFTEV